MEWFALIIPIIGVAALRIFYAREIQWWEFSIPLIVSCLTIFLGKLLAEKITVMDTEYWGGWITQAVYYEDWDEEVPCTHARYTTVTHTDSKGNTYTTQEFAGWQHSYDVDYHPPHWTAEGSNGEEWEITEGKYQEYVEIFGEPIFHDLHRDYHSNDGDAWITVWKGSRSNLQPTATTHLYENRVAKSRSVFSFPEIDPKKSKVFEYPEVDGYTVSSVIAKEYFPDKEEIDKLNAILGAKKKFRMWVLIWTGDVPRSVAFDQQAYWKNGNKNELVVCLNVQSNKNPIVNWCEVFSWSKSENLKTAIKDYLSIDNTRLDLKEFAYWVEPQIVDKWEKRNWHEFDFLSVEPPTWAIVMIWVFTIIATLVSSAICINNGFHNEEDFTGGVSFSINQFISRLK